MPSRRSEYAAEVFEGLKKGLREQTANTLSYTKEQANV